MPPVKNTQGVNSQKIADRFSQLRDFYSICYMQNLNKLQNYFLILYCQSTFCLVFVWLCALESSYTIAPCIHNHTTSHPLYPIVFCVQRNSHLHSTFRIWPLLQILEKRSKRALIKRASLEENNEADYLERWFIGNQEIIDDYYRLYSRKVIISPKVLSME